MSSLQVPLYNETDFLFSNKKKIRGWKRQIKKLEIWKQNHLFLDLENLNYTTRDYVKIYLYPWYNIIKREDLPVWFKKLIFKAMIEIYENWNKQLSKSNKNYYLKIWIFDDNFIHSQIVAAIDESIDYYTNLFCDEYTDNKTIIINKTNLKNELKIFDIKIKSYIEKINNQNNFLALKTKKFYEVNSIKKSINNDGSITYLNKISNVLICSKK